MDVYISFLCSMLVNISNIKLIFINVRFKIFWNQILIFTSTNLFKHSIYYWMKLALQIFKIETSNIHRHLENITQFPVEFAPHHFENSEQIAPWFFYDSLRQWQILQKNKSTCHQLINKALFYKMVLVLIRNFRSLSTIGEKQ